MRPTPSLCLLWLAAVSAFWPSAPSSRRAPLARVRVADGKNPIERAMEGEDGDDGTEAAAAANEGELAKPLKRDARRSLQKRMRALVTGDTMKPSAQLFALMTQSEPHALIGDFIDGATPMVVEAMQETVLGLMGGLPQEFMNEYNSTGQKLAGLALNLQMTGYMLRNAEYVLMLRQILDIKSRAVSEYKAAFDRVDIDGSGEIDASEVSELLRDVYGRTPPRFEVEAFIRFFDADRNNRISWSEFASALGAIASGNVGAPAALAEAAVDAIDLGTDASVAPSAGEFEVSGTIEVEVDGQVIEVQASEYLEKLRDEAARMKAALLSVKDSTEEATTKSLTQYIASLDPQQRSALTTNIAPATTEAMRELVDFMIGGGPAGADGVQSEQEVTLSRDVLSQICMWQLVLGYRLREAEATVEAQKRLGA